MVIRSFEFRIGQYPLYNLAPLVWTWTFKTDSNTEIGSGDAPSEAESKFILGWTTLVYLLVDLKYKF